MNLHEFAFKYMFFCFTNMGISLLKQWEWAANNGGWLENLGIGSRWEDSGPMTDKWRIAMWVVLDNDKSTNTSKMVNKIIKDD